MEASLRCLMPTGVCSQQLRVLFGWKTLTQFFGRKVTAEGFQFVEVCDSRSLLIVFDGEGTPLNSGMLK